MQYTKSIKFNREDKDWSALVNGQIVGVGSTPDEARAICDAYVYEQLRRAA